MILNAHSNYSLRYGTLSPEQLVNRAIERGHEHIALTDINNTSCALHFVKLCFKRNVKPIVGAEFRNGNNILYVALAMNNEGFKEINEQLTQHNFSGEAYSSTPLFHNCYVIYPYGAVNSTQLKEHEYIGVRLTDLNKLLFEKKEQQKKYVILQSSSYLNKEGYEVHKKLRAIDCNLLLSQLQPNQIAGTDEYILPKAKLINYFESYPHIIENTKRIAETCSFKFNFEEIKKHF